MKYSCAEPFSLETSHGKVTLSKGQVLKLSEDQATKLAGYVKPLADEARRLFQEIKVDDPGGDCWQWMQRNRPDLWRSHVKALHDDDITAARLSFNQMLDAWQSRHQMQQTDLLAA